MPYSTTLTSLTMCQLVRGGKLVEGEIKVEVEMEVANLARDHLSLLKNYESDAGVFGIILSGVGRV